MQDIPQKIKLSSIEKSALSDNAKVSKHLIELKKVTTFFGKGLTSKMTSFKQTFDPPTSAPSQQTIETFTNNTQTMKADIIWALTAVVFGLSQNSNNDISNCFCATFPNNATAEEFSLGRTKSTYVVNHSLSPYFKELLT